MNRTDCFLRPHWLQVGGCAKEDVLVGDPSNPNLVGGLFWGCAYNETKNRPQQNLTAPLLHDTAQIWQRSWMVIRFKADTPGYWFFHCHLTQHMLAGMQMVFNVLPSKQPKAPANLPSVGTCPLPGMDLKFEAGSMEQLMHENAELKAKLALFSS
jgi:hypothetical protein